MARQLGLNPDPFLMAVAVGAGCDFLTPIGHQCNTLVMGPGGYRFGDFLRVGGLLHAMTRATEGLDLHLAPDAQSARFECRCSRERAADSLKFFTAPERQEMIDAGASRLGLSGSRAVLAGFPE